MTTIRKTEETISTGQDIDKSELANSAGGIIKGASPFAKQSGVSQTVKQRVTI